MNLMYCNLKEQTSTHLQKFLKQMVVNNNNGNDLAEEVLQRCKAAEPNRGELWCSFAKKTENRRLPTEGVLKKLTKIILQEN